MGDFFKQIGGIWQRMEIPQRVSMVLIAIVFIGIMLAVGVGASQPDYSLLASGLSQADTARIATYLDGQGVPYKLADRDTAVLVPRSERYRLLNQLSEQELISDNSSGFEILAEGGMGETSFMERKRYDRALAGELERAIREIDGVNNARVLVQRPKQSPFLRDERPASAAVKLDMATGRRVSERQLAGIIHLVAGAVGGIDHEQVQVMDDKGLLTRPDQDDGAMAASTSLEAEQAMEHHLMTKAQALLDRVLGNGRSLVSVAVDLDFAKRTEAESTVTDPKIIESTTRETDASTPIPAAGGVAGTASNVEAAGGGTATPAEPATETTAEETTRYAAGKKTTTLDDEVGRIRGMTVSILLDHEKTEKTVTDDEGAESTETAWQPYSAADQDKFKQLVLDAIGFEAAKGVQLAIDPKSNAASRFTATVQSMRLEPVADPFVEEVPAATGMPAEIDSYIRYAIAAIVAIGLLVVARGQLKRSHAAWEVEQAKRAEREAAMTAQNSEPEDVVEARKVEEHRKSMREQIQGQISEDPDAAASILKAWIHNA